MELLLKDTTIQNVIIIISLFQLIINLILLLNKKLKIETKIIFSFIIWMFPVLGSCVTLMYMLSKRLWDFKIMS